jgi:hypothetical protein
MIRKGVEIGPQTFLELKYINRRRNSGCSRPQAQVPIPPSDEGSLKECGFWTGSRLGTPLSIETALTDRCKKSQMGRKR